MSQNYAEHLKNTNSFTPSNSEYKGKSLGENIFWVKGDKAPTGEEITNSWYSEIEYHNFNFDSQPKSIHFTQLIWKSSIEVGFGIANKDNCYWIVANYFPSGNYVNRYKDNVFNK